MSHPQDTPRDRLKYGAPHALTEADLLSIILRTGNGAESALETAERLMGSYRDLSGLLKATFSDLHTLHGLDPNRALALLAALELGRRLAGLGALERKFIQTAEDVVKLLGVEMETLPQEELRVILLDARRQVMTITTVYVGSLNITVVRAAEVFREAVIRNCAGIVLAHNHPSGDPTPSKSDITLTQTLIEAGRLLNIAVVDHVIIGRGAWRSLRDAGVTFV